jgi:hypothetical protein
MSDLTATLARLGAALEGAAADDLARRRPPTRPVTRRRLGIAAVVVAIAAPGAAIATTTLVGGDDVARSMPAGTLSLAGTEPSCTVVRQDVEYHCRLAHAPAPELQDWNGTVEATVDATKHVNGGCRSLRADGIEWECYLGRAAVSEKIIGADFLGAYAPSPGVG